LSPALGRLGNTLTRARLRDALTGLLDDLSTVRLLHALSGLRYGLGASGLRNPLVARLRGRLAPSGLADRLPRACCRHVGPADCYAPAA
jgi:hypothetical protein